MSLKIDRVELEIVIKNDQNRKQLRELEDNMRRITKEMKKLPEGQEAWTKKKNELDALKNQYDAIYDKIGLTGLSLKELRKRQNELNAIIKQLPGNSPLLEKYRKQATDVTARIRELNGHAKQTGISLSRMAEGFNRYFGMATAAIATLTGISLAFRKTATDVAHMDDVYSDVMKTTGLTRDEVVGLNEDLKKMDTRTTRESLNNLARDAGKLGIEGVENIKGFVDAGNQINVALGEDLGENAIKNIGKMVGVYQDATVELQNSGLREQMLAVGSAINDIGATSSADEAFLVEFAARLGGISRQAGIAIDDVIGYASALDQDMQQMEMSATAFSNFIQKLMGNPAKFAKLAGLEVNGFTKLLSTDANAAIKQVLRSLNEKGGFQALIPIFEDMGLDGARAVGVLSSMAASINKIDAAQRQANESLNAGVSITNEYNIKNNNLAAKLDKAKKDFFDVSLQLGEKLNPILLKTTNLTTYLIRGLVKLIPYLPTIGKWALVLTGYLIAYNGQQLLNNILLKEGIGLQLKQYLQRIKDLVVLNATTVSTQIHAATVGKVTIATKAAAAAQVLWNMAMKANPLGLAIGTLSTLIGLIWIFNKKRKEEVLEQTRLLDVENKANESYDTQAAKIKSLTTILNNEKISLQERKKALNELKEIVPGYHAELTQEGKLIKNNTDALKNYLVEFSKKTRLEAAKDKLVELNKQLLDAEREYDEYQAKYNKENPQTNIKIGDTTYSVDMSQEKEIGTGLDLMLTMAKDKVTSIKKDIGEVEKMVEKAVGAGAGSGGNGGGNGGEGGTGGIDEKAEIQRKRVSDAMKELETKNLDEMAKIMKRFRDGEISSDFEYNQLLLSQQDAYDSQRKQKLQELLVGISDSSIKAEVLNQIADIDKQLLERQIEQNQKIKKIILDADPRKAEVQEYENRLRETGLYGLEKEKMTAEQLEAFEVLEKQHNEKMYKLSTKEAGLAIDQLETEQAKAEAVLAERRVKERMSDQKFKDEQLKLELDFLRKKLAIQGLSAEQIETITKQIQEKQNDIVLSGADNREAILQKYGLNGIKDQKEAELAMIQYYEDQGILSHEEALEVKKKLSDEHFRKMLDQTSEYFDAAASIASQASSAVNGFQDAELSAAETKYEKMIRAARKAGRDTTQLEEEKESEQAKIRAKYADSIFIVTVAQIVAQTAKAAIDSYTSMAAIPVVGPALGAAAAAAAVVYGGSQISQAKAARDAAKSGYKVGGFTDDDPDDDKEVGVVHANEFVTSATGVRNPHVRKFLDVFDVAQKRGTIHLLNTTQILEQTKLTGGSRRSGGYGSDARPQILASDPGSTAGNEEMVLLLRQNAEVNEKLLRRLESPIRAQAVISGDDGIDEQLKRYKKLIDNASRT